MIKAKLVVEEEAPYVTLTFSKRDFFKFRRFMEDLLGSDMEEVSDEIWEEIKNIGDE